MANAWGELSWNSGLWGEQSNAIATPTGIDLVVSEGVLAGYPFPGWGSLSWSSGQWGDVQDFDVQLTGIGLTTNSGNVGISGEINEGWGRLEWGENAWGIAGDVLVTGIGVSAGIGTGSVTIDVTVDDAVTGQQLNLNLGQVQGYGLALVSPDGIQLSTELGNVDPAPDVMLTGIGLTTTTGTLDAYNITGWGRLTWGSEAWGATGIWATAEPTGEQLSLNLGQAELDAVTFAAISGNSLTIEEGIVDPSPDATVTGIGLSASLSLGSVVEADANVTISGFDLVMAQGQAELDAVTFAFLTGQQLQIALNSAVAGASAEVDLTGNQLTINLGSINVQSWQIVDTGTTVNWNIIDTAA